MCLYRQALTAINIRLLTGLAIASRVDCQLVCKSTPSFIEVVNPKRWMSLRESFSPAQNCDRRRNGRKEFHFFETLVRFRNFCERVLVSDPEIVQIFAQGQERR